MIDLLYTNSDSVRAAAGVSEAEFPDPFLAARNLDMELRMDLQSWLPTHSAIFATTTTEEEQRLHDALVLYSMNFLAAQLLSSPLSVLSELSDGSNSMKRAAGFEEALRIVGAAARKYRDLLLEATTGQTPAPWSPLGLSEPSYDPVTG